MSRKHARPSTLSRAACSLAPAGRTGLSAVLAGALVIAVAPAAFGQDTVTASTEPGATAGASTEPTPTPAAGATASATATPDATPDATPGATPATAGPATASPGTASPATTASPAPSPAPSAQPSPTAAPTPVLRMSTSTAVVQALRPVTVSGRYYRGAHAPGAGVRLDVLGRRTGGGWNRVATMVTDASGLASTTLSPRTTTELQVRVPAADDRPALASAVRRVEVQPLLRAGLSRSVIRVGARSAVTGTLAPAYAGAVLRVERRLAAGWTPVSAVRTGSDGRFSWPVAPGATGSYAFRAVLPGTTLHRPAVSPTATLVVDSRTLRQGDRGRDVSLLQQRLAVFGVDVGPVDGSYGNDLRHAVTAFQKSQDLPRTGRYDEATRARLAAPRPVRLRHPAAGRAVEVDLTRQVLYYSEGGKVKRLVDISSGNDELYTVDGVTERAYTPQGRFRITRKIDGVRVSRLGELYRPAYFTRGWAVHGSPSVPTYPASHGCVRVTNSSMDRLYGLLTVGTPFSVYRS